MSRLKNYLGSVPVCRHPGLQLVHTANGEDFIDIVESGSIVPHRCSVFNNEDLSYFFVGRPGYKTAISYDPSYWQLPAVFIVESMNEFTPVRIFPFDTGAFHDGRYREIIGKLKLSDFELGNDWSSVGKIVEHFFGNPGHYMRGKALSYDIISDRIGEDRATHIPLALSKLYNVPFNEKIDDRARLIEIQYGVPISLKETVLKAVICCSEWLRDKDFRKKIESITSEIRSFPLLPLCTATYYSKIYEISEEFM